MTVMRSAESGSLFSAENTCANLPFSFRVDAPGFPAESFRKTETPPTAHIDGKAERNGKNER